MNMKQTGGGGTTDGSKFSAAVIAKFSKNSSQPEITSNKTLANWMSTSQA